MKNFKILMLFLSLSFISASAFSQETKKEQIKDHVKKEMKFDNAEIKITDLPEAVQKTLKESFANYTIKKAYKTNEEGLLYYVKLENDGKWLKVAIKADGKVLKQKEFENKDKESQQKS